MTNDYPRHTSRLESEGGLINVCKWTKQSNIKDCPHITFDPIVIHDKKIKDSIADCVGNTPLIRINNITKKEGIECQILAKAEFLNPGGSVKDRIGRRMVIDAEKSGLLKKGDIIIEPTSGNTGVGIAQMAASRGYEMIITLPEKMSTEKQEVLRGLGSTVIRTPTEYARDHLYGYIGIAVTLKEKLGDRCHMLNQYVNTGNGVSHYAETGQEIWDQTEGKVDVVIIGAGTGGTITGIARRLKELNPNIVIVGVDPPGSVLSQPESLNEQFPGPVGGQQTEGIGYDFIPRNLDRTVVDEWIKGPDKESFIMARRLMREEGLMAGGSSGTAMFAAVKYCKEKKLAKDKIVVVVMPDNIRNYLSKHLNADWMYERGYMSEQECADNYVSNLIPNTDWGQDRTVAELPLHEAHFIKISTTCGEAIDLIRTKGFDQFPVKNADGKTVGVLTAVNLHSRLAKNQVKLSDPITRCVVRDLRQVSKNVKLNELARVLTRNSFVLVEDKYFISINDVLDCHNPKKEYIAKQDSEPIQLSKPVRVTKEEEVQTQDFAKWLAMTAFGAALGATAMWAFLKK